jgi:hypothetical protein
MDETPTTEPQSDIFDIVAKAEQRHNNTDKKMRTLEECLAGASNLNLIFEDAVENNAIDPNDIAYEMVRTACDALDHATGEKTTKSADRHLIAAYLCVMRGLPVDA